MTSAACIDGFDLRRLLTPAFSAVGPLITRASVGFGCLIVLLSPRSVSSVIRSAVASSEPSSVHVSDRYKDMPCTVMGCPGLEIWLTIIALLVLDTLNDILAQILSDLKSRVDVLINFRGRELGSRLRRCR